MTTLLSSINFIFLLLSSIFIKGKTSFIEYSKDANKDLVVTLPSSSSPLRSRQYSGFLNIGNNKFIHYYYFEVESNNNNNKVLDKPLVFWTNGGPGCSGLLGLFTEFGPWRPQGDGSLAYNPYTWTTEASIVFLEQPAGVGFSYTTDPSVLNNWNDYSASADFLLTLKSFFEKFPQQLNNSIGFYVASESYGGHYMPQLTLQIFENSPQLLLLFRGMLVGNPFTSYASGSIAMANVIWGLQLVPGSVWFPFIAKNCQDLSSDAYHYSDYCYNLMDELFSYVDSLNPYSLEYPTCPLGSALKTLNNNNNNNNNNDLLSTSAQVYYHLKKNKKIREFNSNNNIIDRNKNSLNSNKHESKLNNNNKNKQNIQNPNYDPCSEIYTVDYLNRLDVQTALHVLRPDGKSTHWAVCSDPVNGNWAISDYLADTTSLYSEIYAHPKKPKGFRMLIYSGDSDGVCATIGTQHWIYNIVGSTIMSLFQPWTYIDSMYGLQQAGFLTKFSNGLSFATVHYAGHEVPGYQPEKALELFKKYLNGTLFYFEKEADTVPINISNHNNNSMNNNNNINIFFIIVISLGAIAFFGLIYMIYFYVYKKFITNSAEPVSTEQFDQSQHSEAEDDL